MFCMAINVVLLFFYRYWCHSHLSTRVPVNVSCERNLQSWGASSESYKCPAWFASACQRTSEVQLCIRVCCEGAFPSLFSALTAISREFARRGCQGACSRQQLKYVGTIGMARTARWSGRQPRTEAGVTTLGPGLNLEWAYQPPKVAADATKWIGLDDGVIRQKVGTRPQKRRPENGRPPVRNRQAAF
ncbi:hypothetical protein MRX96_021153 [Rhipicephalus microplus]